eukprot:gene5266-27984_t
MVITVVQSAIIRGRAGPGPGDTATERAVAASGLLWVAAAPAGILISAAAGATAALIAQA